VGSVRVVFQEKLSGDGLPVHDLGDEPLGREVRLPIVVRSAASPPAPTQRVDYRFGDRIVLEGYDVEALTDGRGLRLTLHWRSRAPISEDYKVFTHLRDTPRTAYAQDDQAPRDDTYPTSAWAAGERVLDVHDLVYPAGQSPPPLTLFIGVYRATDGVRLPVKNGHGQSVPNGEVILPLP
jgi:hypothetical protein